MSLLNLGLAIRAKKVILGTELVLQAVKKKKVWLVLVANDAAIGTLKKVTDKCNTYQVKLSSKYLSADFAQLLQNKNVKVIGITDLGFAKLID